MNVSLWPLVAVFFIIASYKLIDKHLNSSSLSVDVLKKLNDLDLKVNEVSLRTFGRK